MSNCHLVAGRSLIDWAASRLALRAPALLSAFSARRLDHRHLRVLWLHPAHERGCDPSLHAREGRHPRGGAAGQAASDGCRDPACTACWCIGSAQRGLGNDRAARSASLPHGAVRNIDTAVRLTRLAALDLRCGRPPAALRSSHRNARRAMLGKLSPKLREAKSTRRQDCLLRSSFALAFFDLDLLLLLRDFRWLW